MKNVKFLITDSTQRKTYTLTVVKEKNNKKKKEENREGVINLN